MAQIQITYTLKKHLVAMWTFILKLILYSYIIIFILFIVLCFRKLSYKYKNTSHHKKCYCNKNFNSISSRIKIPFSFLIGISGFNLRAC